MDVLDAVSRLSPAGAAVIPLVLALATDARDARHVIRAWIQENRSAVDAAAQGNLAWLEYFVGEEVRKGTCAARDGDSSAPPPVRPGGSPLDRAFLAAIENGQLESVRALLPLHGVHLDARADTDRPLRRAAELGFASIVALLLDRTDADVHVGEEAPLTSAVANRDEEMVATLLARGADPGVLDGFIALFAVHVRAPASIVERLLEGGAPLTADLVESAVANAEADDIQTVALLIQRALRHPDLGTSRSWHDSLVLLGASTCSAPVMRYLLAQPGADDTCIARALCAACSGGNLRAAEELLEAGADPDVLSGAPLRAAVRQGDDEILNMLVVFGADVNQRGGALLVEAVRVGSVDTVDVLLRHGVPPDALGGRALYEALVMMDEAALHVLLRAGGRRAANIATHAWRRPFGHPWIDAPTPPYSGEAYAVVQDGTSGEPLLNVAVLRDDVPAAEVLLEHGADVHAADNRALVCACSRDQHMMMRTLLRYGARPSGVALCTSCATGDWRGVEILLNAGADPDHPVARLICEKRLETMTEALRLIGGGIPVTEAEAEAESDGDMEMDDGPRP